MVVQMWVWCLAMVAGATSQKPITLEGVLNGAEFLSKFVPGQWQTENEYVFIESGQGLIQYNVATGTRTQLIAENTYSKLLTSQGFPEPHRIYKDGDKSRILFYTNYTTIYRNTSNRVYYVYDVSSGLLWKLHDGELLNAILLDMSERPAVAYVYQNNVFYVPDYSKPENRVQLTTDGVPDVLYNGVTDYIYDEEIFDTGVAMWFSRNGTYLAVASFDDSEVDEYFYLRYGENSTEDQYSTVKSVRYPKAGRKNPKVTLNVYKITDAKPQPLTLKAPTEFVGTDHILGRVKFSTDKDVVVTWLNRRQNTSVLLKCDVTTGSCQKKVNLTEPNGWLIVDGFPVFDNTGNRMVDVVDAPGPAGKNRYKHAVLYNFEDGTETDLSPGDGTVTSIEAWNKDTDVVYYQVSPRDAPWQRQLWSTAINSKIAPKCLSCDRVDCSVIEPHFSANAKFALTYCSRADFPYIEYMIKFEENIWEVILNNSELEGKLKTYALPSNKFLLADLDNGAQAHLQLILPPGLDINAVAKYPLVLEFGAPESDTNVMNRYLIDYSSYLAANRSYVMALVDVRGSTLYGAEERFAVFGKYGVINVQDALATIRYLTKNFRYIDSKRVGVFGWEKEISIEILAADQNRILNCAAAIKHIVNFMNYDSIYSERHMGLLTENPTGYNASDLLQQVEQFRDRKLLLISSTDDFNIHVQGLALLSRKLQEAGITFDQMFYPDAGYGLFAVTLHVYRTLDKFWTTCFK